VRTTGEIPHEHLCQSEVHYQNLWSSFHEAIAIKDRRNPVLQRRCMPSRYWKYLPEIS
jgi:probable DNA metabolism protein